MTEMPLVAGVQSEAVPTVNLHGPARVRLLQSMEIDFQGSVYCRPPLQPPPHKASIGAFFSKEARMTPQLEKRVMDIEMGRVQMTRYTLDEYMRHLDETLGG